MAKVNYITIAKKAAAIQISELKKINKIFDKSFVQAVEHISNCKGKVIAAGIGKSGLIARKVSATLSSVGVSSFFLNPSEANHGDLGQIDKRDLLLVFSYSGNTSEISNMLRYANRFNIKIIGVASKKDSLLLKASDIKILLPQVKESDPTGMVPTTSTSITLLLGDCLAVALMNKMNFSKDRFKVFHPGGNIGQTLLLVKDIMITGNKLPKVNINNNIYDATKIIDQKKLGLVVVMKKNQVKGILTDGDARRGIKYYSKDDHLKKFMTSNPLFITENAPASKALSLMNEKKITSLLVATDKDYAKAESTKKLKGIVHIHSLLQYGIK
ncbi:KpsF/GutQ family sugar-phosphate isomerase [Pelagibacteraceae bacterium]|nr:KpsF/GutQ family sugar-phosphate isomerase [Pelagibacteraceae bacterium]|tara:strand:+ start:407 stop:1390 length:984 start_codon:yes stop_codon:yes gene_type:complete